VLTLLPFVIAGLFLAVLMNLAQALDNDQGRYFRHLVAIGILFAYTLCGQNPGLGTAVGLGTILFLVGFLPNRVKAPLRPLILAGCALLWAALGPRISFVGIPGSEGKVYFLTQAAGFWITAVWLASVPFILQVADRQSGLGAITAAVAFASEAVALVLYRRADPSALATAVMAASLILVLRRCPVGNGNRMGPSACFWGFLLASTALVGVGKGVALGAVLLVPALACMIPALMVSKSMQPSTLGFQIPPYLSLKRRMGAANTALLLAGSGPAIVLAWAAGPMPGAAVTGAVLSLLIKGRKRPA
jgi:N-acetylglucosaminyldiphosphoundecaprenol N-acetyl-beta-D-mannosaminyltransferase